jgi:hypothetical protein
MTHRSRAIASEIAAQEKSNAAVDAALNRKRVASYWFVGVKNFSQSMAVAIDLLDVDGELIEETTTFPAASRVHGDEIAKRHCMAHGVAWPDIHYDEDSTKYFELC